MRPLLNWLHQRRDLRQAIVVGVVFVLALQFYFGERWNSNYRYFYNGSARTFTKMQHYKLGWPMTCLHIEQTEKTRWHWRPTALAFDLGIGVGLVMSLAYISTLRRRQGPRGQYSVASLMALVTATAITIVTLQELGPKLELGYLGGFESDLQGAAYDFFTVGSIAAIVFAATWGVKNALLRAKPAQQPTAQELSTPAE